MIYVALSLSAIAVILVLVTARRQSRHIDRVAEALQAFLQDKQSDQLTMIEQLELQVVGLNAKFRSLDPEETRERFERYLGLLESLRERIDDAIGTARNLGETAGQNAARALIRECLERGAAGKGPPISLLPQRVVNAILELKLDDTRRT